tara:strand:+ start:436 stop:903 length:468 start_codon:yes stop_codon:yes gene_type:complete
MNIFNYSSFYQGPFLSSLLFIPLAFGFNPNNIKAHEILMPEGTAIEAFDAFCSGTSYELSYELKINDPNKACVVKIRYKSDYFKATFQVDNGIPITKDQFLEIIPLSKPFGWSRYYTYKILYKDENAKVVSAQIIFTNKQRSLEFGQALKRFGNE